jgi:hypothetical protein
MKRWLCSLWLAVGVMFLLWMPHRCVRPQLHPQDQSVLSQKEFVSTWIRALRATNPAFIQSRAGPLEFFATEFGLSVVAITSDDGPPWLDSRGPPALRCAIKTRSLVCKAAGQAGSQTGRHSPIQFRASRGKFNTRGFATRFS